MPQTAFTGGRLKLKGASKPDKKKKKKKAVSLDDAAATAAPVDGRTEAQRRHDEIVAAREAERIAALASKSHQERVAEFNEKLAQLSEHHDIPKVGPG